MKSSESGKSLTELLVVIVIIGILASIGLPMFLNYLKASRLVATIHQVKAYTTQSRYDAITDSGIKTVCILEGKITSTTDGNCNDKSIKSLPSGVTLDIPNSTLKVIEVFRLNQMNKTKLKFSTQLRKLTTVQNPEALRDWCRSLKSQLIPDPSNYAKGRYRLWLFHEVDFRNGQLSKGYFDDRIYNFSQRVYPGCDIGLLTFGGSLADSKISDGRIDLHRDHTYSNPKAISVNLGEAIFSYGEPEQTDYLLQDGDITEFNCKVLHAVKEIITPERFSLVFWKLNESKGYKPLT